jgi:putative ABC transport system permease protein
MYAGGSFRIRRGYVAGIHSYPSPTESLNRVILADPTIVRGLVDYTQGYARAGDAAAGGGAAGSGAGAGDGEAGGSLDSLFAEAEDTVADAEEGLSADSVERRLSQTEERDRLVQTDDAAWSFVLFRAADGDRGALQAELSRVAGEGGWEVRVLDWRDAAGLSAQVVFALQLGLYAGLVILTVGAILVIMNALVISVLERRTEIGTMRGLGADGGFVSRLFMTESVLLTMAASVVGIALGILASRLAAQSGITLENPLLQSLFGGVEVRPVVRPQNVLIHLGLGAGIGLLAWIYPVLLAVRIQPASIMRQG